MGLKFWSSWGSGCKYSKTPSRLDFFDIILKVEKNTKDFPVNWTQIKFQGIFLVRKRFGHFQNHSTTVNLFFSWKCFFCELFFKGLSLIKLKLISFFIARYLTDSLRGPVLTLQNEALCAEFPDGMGLDGGQKCPLIFFISRYIKH